MARTRRRSGLAKIGILCLVLLVAMGALGTTFGMWVEYIYIEGTVYTGSTEIHLSPVPDSCTEGASSAVTGNILTVHVTEAQIGVEYTCQFKVTNTGSIPVKIQSITCSAPPTVNAWVTGIDLGDQIDEGQFKTGTAHVELDPGSPFEGTNVAANITITAIEWNQYVPVPP